MSDEEEKLECVQYAEIASNSEAFISMPALNTENSRRMSCNGKSSQKKLFCSFSNPLKAPDQRLCDTKCKEKRGEVGNSLRYLTYKAGLPERMEREAFISYHYLDRNCSIISYDSFTPS